MDKLLAPGIFRLFLAYVVVFHHLSVISFGGWAVYVFFILSGYWITEVWVKKYSHLSWTYLRFEASRYMRLAPVFLVCFLIAMVVLRLTSQHFTAYAEPAHHARWWWELVSIIFAADHNLFLPPIWSIVVEMQFYIVAPLLIWMAMKLANRSGQPVRPVTRGVITLGLVAATLLSIMSFLESQDAVLNCYIFCFLMGILISTTGYCPSKKVALASIGLMFLLAALSYVSQDVGNIFGAEAGRTSNEYWHLMNRYACAVLGILTVPYVAYSVRVRSGKVDRELGNLSYPLYLFHFSVVFLFENLTKLAYLPHAVRVVLSLVVMTVGTLAIYYVVDRPMENLRRKWFET